MDAENSETDGSQPVNHSDFAARWRESEVLNTCWDSLSIWMYRSAAVFSSSILCLKSSLLLCFLVTRCSFIHVFLAHNPVSHSSARY